MQTHPKSILILVGVGLLLLLATVPFNGSKPTDVKPYSYFVQDLTEGKVARATVSGTRLSAVYLNGARHTITIPDANPQIHQLLLTHGAEVVYLDARSAKGAGSFSLVLLVLGAVGGMIWYMQGRGSGGGPGQVFSFGESKARLYDAGANPVTMQDVAGMTEVKEEVAELVDFLRTPDRYQQLGAQIPRGVLLWGPPGTGKTLLARAVAGEAGVPFFSICGSDFVEMFAGVGAARVRDLFAKARKQAPCIIFVDEIDAVGRRRGASVGGGSDEREQTLNQLLVEMDGFNGNEGIIVMAATNRADVLDAAILRPGRFDRQIVVDLPDRQGRREILTVHAGRIVMEDEVDLENVAGMTLGFTGADLANLLNEAALLAARQRRPAIGMEQIRQAYERIVTGGPSLTRNHSQLERERVAVHEAGHAVISRHVAHSEPIEKVTITPRGRALGYVMYRPGEDRNFHSRTEMLDRIIILLGGRAAEEAVLGEVSSGAAEDLEQATSMARRMVTELGMSPRVGPLALASDPSSLSRKLSDRTSLVVDSAVRDLIMQGYERALELVRRHRRGLDRLTAALLAMESIDGSKVEELLGD